MITKFGLFVKNDRFQELPLGKRSSYSYFIGNFVVKSSVDFCSDAQRESETIIRQYSCY